MEQLHRFNVQEGNRQNNLAICSAQFAEDSGKLSINLAAFINWQALFLKEDHRCRQGTINEHCEYDSFEKGITEETALLEPNQRKPGNASNLFSKSAGSWQVAVFLLANTALGAGILNYPAAYHRLGGIWISTLLQAIVLFLIGSTMLALVFCANLHDVTVFHDVLRSMIGKRAQQLAGASIMLTCFGVNVTFLVIIGDQFDRLFSTFVGANFCETFWLNRNFTISLIACLLIWPICYFKRFAFLRYISTIGMFTMFYVVFLNIYEYYTLKVTPGVIKTAPTSALQVASSLPVIFFTYQTHEIVLPVYAGLAKPKSTNFIKSTVVSMTVLFVIYTLSGTYGYLTFGSKVMANVTQMYDARDPVVTIGIVALIIKMITTYPSLMFSGREALDGLYAEWKHLSAEAFICGEKYRRIVITSLWNVTVLMLAIFTPDINIAIEILGSLAAYNVFVFPGLCMVSLARRHLNGYYDKLENKRRMLQIFEGSKWWTLVWYSLIVYGAFITFFGCVMFAMIFVQVFNHMNQYQREHVEHETPHCGLHRYSSTLVTH